jgi:hypothetical protein
MRLSVRRGRDPLEQDSADAHPHVGYVGLELDQAGTADVPLAVDVGDQKL